MNPITDLITRIKNSYMAGKETVKTPHSKYREELVKKLVGLGYVKDYTVTGDIVKTMELNLVYKDGIAALTQVKIYSTPGRRWYVSSKEIRSVLGGMGYSLLSTPQGILTNVEAKKKNVGGELLFSIW